MKNTVNFIATLVLAVVLSFVFPWWAVMVAGFVSAYVFSLKKAAVFFVPFLAIFLFWAVYAFILGNANDFILAKRIAVLLTIGSNPYLLILVTGLVGGLAGGISAIFGKQLAVVIKPSKA